MNEEKTNYGTNSYGLVVVGAPDKGICKGLNVTLGLTLFCSTVITTTKKNQNKTKKAEYSRTAVILCTSGYTVTVNRIVSEMRLF